MKYRVDFIQNQVPADKWFLGWVRFNGEKVIIDQDMEHLETVEEEPKEDSEEKECCRICGTKRLNYGVTGFRPIEHCENIDCNCHKDKPTKEKTKEHNHSYSKLMGIDEYCVGCHKHRVEIEQLQDKPKLPEQINYRELLTSDKLSPIEILGIKINKIIDYLEKHDKN